jgi:hypothetical protein
MEIQLEGVFYVVRPEAISRQSPVVRHSWVIVEYSPVTGVPHQIHLSTTAVPNEIQLSDRFGYILQEFSAWIVKSASVNRRLVCNGRSVRLLELFVESRCSETTSGNRGNPSALATVNCNGVNNAGMLQYVSIRLQSRVFRFHSTVGTSGRCCMSSLIFSHSLHWCSCTWFCRWGL